MDFCHARKIYLFSGRLGEFQSCLRRRDRNRESAIENSWKEMSPLK